MYTQAPLRSHDVVPGDELGEAPRGGEESVGVVAHGHEVALVVLAPARASLHLPPLHPGLRGGPGHHGVQCSRYPNTRTCRAAGAGCWPPGCRRTGPGSTWSGRGRRSGYPHSPGVPAPPACLL